MRVWHPWALDGDSGAMKLVLWPYDVRLLRYSFSKSVSGLEHRERHRAAFQRFTQFECTGGSGHRVTTGAYLAKVAVERIAWEVYLNLVKESASCAAVLVGACATTTWIAGSDYYRVIVFFKYPTQCSKCLSGVLKFQLRSLI